MYCCTGSNTQRRQRALLMAICLGHAHTQGFPYTTLPLYPHSIPVLGAAVARLLVVFGAIVALNPNPAFFLAFTAAAPRQRIPRGRLGA